MLIYGTGGHAKVVFDCLQDLDLKVDSFFDDKILSPILFEKPVNYYNDELYKEEPLVIAIGDNTSREKVSLKVSHPFLTVIHKSSIISSNAEISEGSMIMQGTVVQTNASVGAHVIVNTAATVDHDCQIGSYAHIAPNATLCGNVKVGEGTLIGSGSTIIPGIKIGRWCVIGAGSVIINDIPDFSMVVGNPAKIIKQLNQ